MFDLLLRPATTFRAWSSIPAAGSAWRGPLLLALALGVTTSAFASGRISARLVVDGVISFAFVPIAEVITLAVVSRLPGPRRRVPFSRLLDLFTAGNLPWLLWLTMMSGIFAVVSARTMSNWFSFTTNTFVVPAIWSLWIDVHFFEEVAGRTRRQAIVDTLVERAIAWPLAAFYFYGIGIYSYGISWLVTRGWIS